MLLLHLYTPIALLPALICTSVVSAAQIPLKALYSQTGDQDEYYQFSHPIRRVAVIGAGIAGLQAAASLIENEFEVRLFERGRGPGGNWFYQDETPVQVPFS